MSDNVIKFGKAKKPSPVRARTSKRPKTAHASGRKNPPKILKRLWRKNCKPNLMDIKSSQTNPALMVKVPDSNFSIPTDIKREKRSLSLYGHRTSVALETPFWATLDNTAKTQNMSLAGLLCELDDARIAAKSELGLAAYLRVWAMIKAKSGS